MTSVLRRSGRAPARRRSWPSSTCIASSRLPSVADRPQTTRPGSSACSRASASCTCTPRLLPISSCHSSTITVCTPAELVARVLARQHQAERLGRRDQRGREAPVLPRALGRRACRRCACRPSRRAPSVVERRLHRPRRVGGERAHRREPEHAERRRRCALPLRAARRAPRRARARRTRPRRSCPSRWSRAAGRSRPRPSPPRPRAGRRTAASRAPANQASAARRHFDARSRLCRSPCAPACGARRSSSAASPRCRGRRSRRPPSTAPARPSSPPSRGARPWFIAYAR